MTNGVASLSIALSAGSHSITAMYGGDANFVSLTSAAVVESVRDFNLASSGTSTAQTVTGGSVATYTLSISPVNGSAFPAAVTFTASGLQPGAIASFTPQTIAAGSGTTNVSLAIQTVKLTSEIRQNSRSRFGAAALALLLPFSFAIRRPRRRLVGLACLVMLGVFAMSGLTGCGGGSSNSTPPTTTTTTPQTYMVTVTATSGTLSHVTPLTLTVQ